MKSMKRSACLLTAWVAVAGLCLGCGGPGPQKAEIPTQPGVAVKPEDLGRMNFGPMPTNPRGQGRAR
jgi:hypothetical protein